MVIRKAQKRDVDQVEQGYTEFLLHEQAHGAFTAWKLGVYPTRETAEKGLAAGTLYVMETGGKLWASMILDQVPSTEYEKIAWRYAARPDQVAVMHSLCVRPTGAGKGIGTAMVKFAMEEARNMGCNVIRLDTGAQNKPAVGLYTKMGFELAGTSSMEIGGLISHRDHLFFERKL